METKRRTAAWMGMVIILALAVIFSCLLCSRKQDVLSGKGPAVAVLEISGDITNSRKIIDEIMRVKKSPEVVALVLRINSPGGEISEAQEIYSQLRLLREKKVVVASLGPLAASAAYYVALGGQKIVSNPGTLTGNIGTVLDFFDYEGLLGKVGIKHKAAKSGKYKDTSNYFHEVTPEEEGIMQSIVISVAQDYINLIIKERGITPETAKLISDGRLLTGTQAKELKLVDVLGGLQETIELAAGMAKIKGEPRVVYLAKTQTPFWLKYLRGGLSVGSYHRGLH